MGKILLISDDERRARPLVRSLDLPVHTHVHDIYGKCPPPGGSELIVVDVDAFDSSVISRLRSVLNTVRSRECQLLFLAHGNPARAEAQARILGATEMMPASAPPEAVSEKISQMWTKERAAPTSLAVRKAAEARQFLVQAFFSATVITPELTAVGSDLIAHAVAESGVKDWVRAVQRFDDATHQHCLLVAGLSAAFANRLGFGRTESFRLTKAALLHDVGKTRIPLSILNKPGPLTPEDMVVMRTHAVEGYDMLKGGGFSQETLLVVRSHHELLDGSGYPDRLLGDEIPDLVRLVTICDIFGALIERRPYKPPMPAAKAHSILTGMKGRLDLDLVGAFQPVTASMV